MNPSSSENPTINVKSEYQPKTETQLDNTHEGTEENDRHNQSGGDDNGSAPSSPGQPESPVSTAASKPTRSGRRKINIEFIDDKSRRHITFSKRKAGIMKKAYELSTLTGTQVLLLVASETGHVYTFATPKLQPLITKPEGKNLIQACLNATEALQSHTVVSSPQPTSYQESYAQQSPYGSQDNYSGPDHHSNQSPVHSSYDDEAHNKPNLPYSGHPHGHSSFANPSTVQDIKPFANSNVDYDSNSHYSSAGYSAPHNLMNPVRMPGYHPGGVPSMGPGYSAMPQHHGGPPPHSLHSLYNPAPSQETYQMNPNNNYPGYAQNPNKFNPLSHPRYDM